MIVWDKDMGRYKYENDPATSLLDDVRNEKDFKLALLNELSDISNNLYNLIDAVNKVGDER